MNESNALSSYPKCKGQTDILSTSDSKVNNLKDLFSSKKHVVKNLNREHGGKLQDSATRSPKREEA